MRKKKFKWILAICILTVVTSLLVACQLTNPGGKTPSDDNNNDGTNDGFVTAQATVEDMSAELVGGINSALRPATTAHLGAEHPNASIYTEWQVSINDKAALLTFAIDYDYAKFTERQADATRMIATLVYEGETEPDFEVYFYSDDNFLPQDAEADPNNARSGGNLYISLGDADIYLPLFDSSLSQLLPMNVMNGTLISQVLSASINFSELQYSYKDEEGSKRTRRYTVEIDVAQTLSKLLSYFDRDSELEQYLSPVKELIEAIFGVSTSNLEKNMPETTLKVYFETTGGLRNTTGSGRLSDIKVELNVAASQNTQTIFGGKEYDIIAELMTCEVKSSAISPEKMPASDDPRFENYYVYDAKAMRVDGKIRYFDPESPVFEAEKFYDIDLAFQYCGLSDSDPDSTVHVTITDPDNPSYVPLDLKYYDGKFEIIMQEKDKAGEIITNEYVGNGNFKKFLGSVIDSFEAKDSMGVLEVMAFIFKKVRISSAEDQNFVSLICDEEFFRNTLGLGDGKGSSAETDPMKEFIDCLQSGYSAAGGSGMLSNIFAEKNIDFGKYIIETKCEVRLNISGDFFELTEEVEM